MKKKRSRSYRTPDGTTIIPIDYDPEKIEAFTRWLASLSNGNANDTAAEAQGNEQEERS